MSCYESHLAGSLLSANEVSIRGSEGQGLASGAILRLLPAEEGVQIVFFPCYVPGGNSVTLGLDSPLVCLWEGYK